MGIVSIMLSDPSVNAVVPPTVPPTPPVRDKVRLRFHKGGDLRLLSHHDLMRTFERLLRRAALPMCRTQGFNPHLRLVFALSLPLGVVGCEEVAELELEPGLSLEEIEERLKRQCPPGLSILSVRRIDPRTTAQVRALCYRVAVPAERVEATRQRIPEVLAAPECWVERTRPPARRLDIRPFLRDLRLIEGRARGVNLPMIDDTHRGVDTPRSPVHLEMHLWLTPQGTARPDEVLSLLGLQDLPPAGAVLERSRLELHDESPEGGSQ
jgi:radical SAM-linked protein